MVKTRNNIQNCVDKYLEEGVNKTESLPAMIEVSLVREYINIAFADISDFFSVGKDNSIKIKDLKKLPSRMSCAVKELNHFGNKTIIKMHEKKHALEFVAKYFGISSCDLSEDEVEKRILDLLGKAGIAEKAKKPFQA